MFGLYQDNTHPQTLESTSGLIGFQLHAAKTLRKSLNKPQGNTTNPDPRRQFSGPHIDQGQKIRALMYFQQNIDYMCWLAQQKQIPLFLVVPVRDLNRAPLGECREEPCAGTLYDQGMAMRTQNPTRALELLKASSDADGIPLRVLTSAQDYLRKKKGKGIFVIDAPSLLAQKDGGLSSSLFQDHVHLSAEGHIKMGEVLSKFISAQLEKK